MSLSKYALAIHGGAGTLLKKDISPSQEKAYVEALSRALEAGHSVLRGGGTALDAVTQSVKSLEDCPLFNAGKGSVYNAKGQHEMDASIMEGKYRQAGAVSLVQGIRNPILLARDVMEKSDHVLLAGQGAMQYAQSLGYILESEEYFHDAYRYEQWQKIKGSEDFKLDHWDGQDEKFGTVGAVALDVHGQLAAATSTGGMTNKKFGRIGDTPIIGAGTYADNRYAAISCTGSGEYFIRGVAAYDVIALVRYGGHTLEQASSQVIDHHLTEIGGDGGLISIDPKGSICMPFNTEGMYRAAVNTEGHEIIKIFK